MRRILHLCLVGLLGTASAFAQPGAAELDAVEKAARDIAADAKSNGLALRTLLIDYFILGIPDPDADGFVTTTLARQAEIETAVNDILANINAAAAADPYIDPAYIQLVAGQIAATSDQIEFDAVNLRDAILADDDPQVVLYQDLLRAYIRQQFDDARSIVEDARQWMQSFQTYDVRIDLVDQFGNPVTGPTGLMGYYAFNEHTGEYVYPDYLAWDEFTDLRGGTWTFGAFDGYFDGAGSNTVTLRPALAGPDGYIPVTLSYWSE